jgi:hypothetical protein
MNRIVKVALAVALVAVAILAVAKPRMMVEPGTLIPGHRSLNGDCLACHAPFGGADAARCVVCHKPADIGLRTTKGLPNEKPLAKTPFHQKLMAKDCVACHSDHAGVVRARPQGGFDHRLLEKDALNRCQDCHRVPEDGLHRQVFDNCARCHSQEKWTPATFEHDRFFRLDRDHAVRCATCHDSSDYKLYSCYGCHEHTASGMRSAHIEEGVRNYDNCVECHRSADKDAAGREGSRGDGEGKEGEEGGDREGGSDGD